LDVLDEKGLAKDTLVVFIGDHGPPMTRGKTTTYEFGVRIPYIVRWPGKARAGVMSDALVSTVDLLPTCVTAAGGTLPKPLSGLPLQAPLQGDASSWRETLVTEWHTHGPGFQPQRAIRDARYKLILNLRTDVSKHGMGVDGCAVGKAIRKNPEAYKGTDVKRVLDMLAKPPAVELYDLQADPVEFHNLAGKPELRDVEQRLKAQLQAWREQTHDPFLDPATFAAYKNHYDEYCRTLPEKKKTVKPDKHGRRRVKMDMAPFQRDWADVRRERYGL